MKKLLVCQHVPHEILGTLNPLLKRAGFRIRYVNFGRHPDAEPSLEGYHGLVVLGGPMSVNDAGQLRHLTTEMKLIEQAMKRNLPVLGICLGSQLIAKTLGANVYPNKEKEIGWYDVSPTEEAERDPLLVEFRRTEKIFQWHGDTFDIPKSTVRLALAPVRVTEAEREGGDGDGLQLDLEVGEWMSHRWLKVPENRQEIDGDERIDPLQIHGETPELTASLHQLSDLVFSEVIKNF